MDHIIKPSFTVVPDQDIRSIINNLSPEFKKQLDDILIEYDLDMIDRLTKLIIEENQTADNK